MGTVRAIGLVKTFGAVLAVNNLSFEAKAGEFLTLLGPSGCGKTTTLRLVAGLERPDRGEIFVGGRALSAAESGLFVPPERRGMGMVFQSYAIWPHMTVFENVAFPLQELRRPRPEIRDRVMTILGTVGLGGLHDRPAPMLSGGQQQRGARARALVSNPDGRWVVEVDDIGFRLTVDGTEAWHDGQEVLLAFRPEAVEARPAERDGSWVGVVRSSVYVSGHLEYVVDLGKFTVRATGSEDHRLPHDARARLHVAPRAVRVWPRSADGSATANGGRPR